MYYLSEVGNSFDTFRTFTNFRTNHRIHIHQIQKLEYEIYFMTSQHSNTVYKMNQVNKFHILAF